MNEVAADKNIRRDKNINSEGEFLGGDVEFVRKWHEVFSLIIVIHKNH